MLPASSIDMNSQTPSDPIMMNLSSGVLIENSSMSGIPIIPA